MNKLILLVHHVRKTPCKKREILLLPVDVMKPNPDVLLEDRVEFKTYAAWYHLEEIKKLKQRHAGLHSDMPSVHLRMEVDCFLSQIYGSIDALLVLINSKLNLGIPINSINLKRIESKLTAIGRNDLIAELIDASKYGNWLSELYEFRNHAIHREKLNTMREYDAFTKQARVYISKKQREISFNPSDYMPIEQVQYFEESLERVQQLIQVIRMKDKVLQHK